MWDKSEWVKNISLNKYYNTVISLCFFLLKLFGMELFHEWQ